MSNTRLSQFLPYQLSITSNAYSSLIANEYQARFGLKIPEWRVMTILGDLGSATQRDMVRSTRMDKVAVNRACKVLEERALIMRSPNASDGRSHHLELTAAGKALHAEIWPMAQSLSDKVTAALSAEEIAALEAILAKLLARTAELDR